METNLKHYEEMHSGKPGGEKWCLRAKINMQSVNGTMRDPVLYRANYEDAHVRTGTKYKAYPTYDFACPVVDSIEGVTHAMRTTEYNDRAEQFEWVIKALNLRPVTIQEFARMSFQVTDNQSFCHTSTLSTSYYERIVYFDVEEEASSLSGQESRRWLE